MDKKTPHLKYHLSKVIKLYEENCEILINKKLVIETGWCGASCIVLLKVFRKNRTNRMCTYAFGDLL